MKKIFITILLVVVISSIFCISAFAVVSESSGNGHALYDGLYYPAKPTPPQNEYVSEPYSYSFLTTYLYNSDGVVFVLEPMLTFTTDTLSVKVDTDGNLVFYNPHEYNVGWYATEVVDDAFSFHGDGFLRPNEEYSYVTDLNTEYQVHYSSYDIRYDTGVYYFESTSYIPTDGFTIVQWDGNVTDLPVNGNLYTVSDFVSVDNAFSVWHYGVGSLAYNLRPVFRYEADGDSWSVVDSDNGNVVIGNSNTGISFLRTDSRNYTSLLAYRESESTPDEPQPLFGAAEIYLKLYLLELTPQLK